MNMVPTVIGLTGYKESGKSTTASILVDRYGFTRLSFGTTLKQMVRRINPIISFDPVEMAPLYLSDVAHADVDDTQLKKEFPEYRRFLQRLATEGIRKADDDFWIRCLLSDMKKHMAEGRHTFVIDDCRFPNEAQFIHQVRGSNLWLIEGRIDRTSDHESEAYVGKLGENATITNDGDIEQLADRVKNQIRLEYPKMFPDLHRA